MRCSSTESVTRGGGEEVREVARGRLETGAGRPDAVLGRRGGRDDVGTGAGRPEAVRRAGAARSGVAGFGGAEGRVEVGGEGERGGVGSSFISGSDLRIGGADGGGRLGSGGGAARWLPIPGSVGMRGGREECVGGTVPLGDAGGITVLPNRAGGLEPGRAGTALPPGVVGGWEIRVGSVGRSSGGARSGRVLSSSVLMKRGGENMPAVNGWPGFAPRRGQWAPRR
jgi:hypothetical protein